MEIIKTGLNYQLVDCFTREVILEGTKQECESWLSNFEKQYQTFLEEKEWDSIYL